MELTGLSFDVLLGYLQQAIAGMVDPRRPSNGARYSLEEVVMGAFIGFFMQSESFLEHQRHLKSRCGRDNAQTLFGLEKIPRVEQMRNLLDKIAARRLFVVFEWIYQALKVQGYLSPFEVLDRDGCVAAEPGLKHVADKFVGGLRLTQDRTGDCRLFTMALAEKTAELGAVFHYGVTIEEIAGNILDNALKWTDSEITIYGGKVDGGVEFSVIDDGPGVPQEQLPQILERGRRLDEATPGTGLGLAIIQDILSIYDGRLDIDNARPRGLRVKVTLPA